MPTKEKTRLIKTRMETSVNYEPFVSFLVLQMESDFDADFHNYIFELWYNKSFARK